MKKKNSLQDPFADREAAKYEHPIPSRELISQILSDSPGPLAYKVLARSLGIDNEQKQEAFRRRIRAMERDGQLIANRKGEYGLTGKMDLIRGRVQGHRDGFGFVIPSDGSKDIYLTHRQMQKVFDGDEVLVRPGKINFKGKQEGYVVDVLARNTQQLVGRLVSQNGVHFVRPENARNCHDVLIGADHLLHAEAGQFVVVELIQQPSRDQKPSGKIAEVLGEHMAPGMEIDVAIRSYGIPNTWPEDVDTQCLSIPTEVQEGDKKNRVDLRALPFVTIDGEDARDFDDAVYCETKKSGGWRLYVAIADVAHYVKAATPLDEEAKSRGNSVYFPDFVVPMLPQALSNGLCSLNPKVDRLCLVCEMTISEAGRVSGYVFYEGVIHSHGRLTYSQVASALDATKRGTKKAADELVGLNKHIHELYRVYQSLRVQREDRGAIDFATKETRIVFDSLRKIEKIVPVERNEAHKLIEECMLAANVCAAKLLESHEVPALYRVHEEPNPEKLEMLHQFLGELGLSMKGKRKVSPQDYCDVLRVVSGRPDAHIIQTVMLRSMNQARYQVENLGHFGLAFPAYAHFTSPIRRYPDLIVHRAIRALIRSNVETKRVKRVPGVRTADFDKSYPYTPEDMSNFGEHASTTERRADEATRDVVSWLKCEYLQERVGEAYFGVVSAVTSFGLFVELNDLFVEGLIHITSLPQDYYHYEAAQHRLVGERTRKMFRLGDELHVQVARVDLDERKVDFEFVGAKRAKPKKSSRPKKPPTRKAPNGARKVRKRPIKKADATAVEEASESPKKRRKAKPISKSRPANKSKPSTKTVAKKAPKKAAKKGKAVKKKKIKTKTKK